MKPVLILLQLIFLSYISIGQHICGFDEMHKRQMEQDIIYRRNVLENEKKIKETLEKNKNKIGRAHV